MSVALLVAAVNYPVYINKSVVSKNIRKKRCSKINLWAVCTSNCMCAGIPFTFLEWSVICLCNVLVWREHVLCICRSTRICSSGPSACVTRCRWRRRRRWTASRGASIRAGQPPSIYPPHPMRWRWWREWKGTNEGKMFLGLYDGVILTWLASSCLFVNWELTLWDHCDSCEDLILLHLKIFQTLKI